MTNRKKRSRFSPIHHVPAYTVLLFEALVNPLVIYMIGVGNIILAGSVLLFYNFEFGKNPHVHSLFDALWWGMSTVTTVGYGDVIAVTLGGKLISFFLMVTGIVFFVGWTAVVMSIFLRQAEEDIYQSEKLSLIEYEVIVSKLDELSQKLERLEKQGYDKGNFKSRKTGKAKKN